MNQVVPKCFKDIYGKKLNDIRILKVGGQSCFILYNYKRGYLANLEKMIGRFKLKGNETMVFTVNSTNVMHGRIYDRDGKEIDYENHAFGIQNNGMSGSFWDVEWDLDTGIVSFLFLNA